MARHTDPLKSALDAAAVETKARIRADRRKKIPPSLKAFLGYLGPHLFDADLTVKRAKRKKGIRDNSMSTTFRLYLGRRPLQYLHRRRLETADRLIRIFGLEVGEAATLVGIQSLKTFGRLYEAWLRERAAEAGCGPESKEIDDALWRRAVRGELEPEVGLRLAERLRGIYAGGEEEEKEETVPPPMLDGRARERWRAAALWEEIRELPFAEQRSQVRWHLFRTPALFDLLREKSRQEGRRDRQRGIRLAELALASLDGSPEALTDKGHDRRALGLAWLGNARRLAFDFSGAEKDLTASWAEWRTPRENPDPLVESEICFLHGTLRMVQRLYDEALLLLNRAITCARQAGNRNGEIRALIQRAAVNGYMGRLEDETSDLEEVAVLTETADDGFLRLNAKFNLAVAHVRRGEFQAAAAASKRLQSIYRSLDYPKGHWEIEHLEGNINEGMGDYSLAEKRYARAYRHFVELEEWRGAAFAGLDLALVSSIQDKHEKVLGLVSDLIPILESLRLYPETLAAVRLLADALAEMEITQTLLRTVREQLQQDPLVHSS